MSLVTDLCDAVAERLGRAEPILHTAVPPIQLGGSADVLEFRNVRDIPGVVYLSAAGTPELILCTPAPARWAPSLLSRLAAAGRLRSFAENGTVPLGDPDTPFAGFAFAALPRLRPICVAGSYITFLLALGVTKAELDLCRSHGVLHLVELLRTAGLFPYSEPTRPDVPGVLTAGTLYAANLSAAGKKALAAVIHAQWEDIEYLRGRYPDEDLPHLAAAYAAMVGWDQRCALIALTQDSTHPTVAPIRRAFLADALTRTIEDQSSAHVSLAVSLCMLEGDGVTFDVYWGDLEVALARARDLAGR